MAVCVCVCRMKKLGQREKGGRYKKKSGKKQIVGKQRHKSPDKEEESTEGQWE